MGFYGGRPGADFKIDKIISITELDSSGENPYEYQISKKISFGELVLIPEGLGEEVYEIYTKDGDTSLKKLAGINLSNAILQGYDGASNYKGVYK